MLFRSPDPPLDIPDVALTPFLLERAERHGDRAAFVDGSSGRVLTFRGWADAVRRTAAGLAARGFGPRDVFALYSPNLPEYAVAFHAVSLLGGINTTVNPLYTPDELRQQLNDSGATHLVTVAPCLSRAAEGARGTRVRELYVFGEAEGATPFASLLTAGGEPPVPALAPREDLVALPYSSGTTGFPKGVMLTHRNLVANILQAQSVLRLDERDTVLGLLPFFHIYGMVVIMNLSLHAGATVVTMPRFDLEGMLELVQRHRITYGFVVPPIVLALAKSPVVERYDVRSLRVIFSGAAPLAEGVARAAAERLGCAVLQGYGLTETSPVTHGTRPADAGRKPAGVGAPVANTDVKIVSVATGEALGPGQEGEICVRGPQVMKGYLNRPDATAAIIDRDGWLHTGDIGFADEESCFFVVDRVKELIKYKGMQIAPAELEAVLLGHPAIADAAVIGVPDEEAGEVPKGFVVLKSAVPPEEILQYVAARVAPYKKVRRLEVIEQIPKSPSGKILRRLLVERERAGV